MDPYQNALHRISDHLQRREMAIFLGPELPRSLTGMPAWTDLAGKLAEHGGFSPTQDWPTAAARYVQMLGRRNLIDWMNSQIEGQSYGPIYDELANLPVAHYITTTYDDSLQVALQKAGRPANIVIEDPDLNFIQATRPTVVKLLGEFSPGRRNALLLTASDLQSLLQLRAKILMQEVWPVFRRVNLLVLGQNLNHPLFRDLYYYDLPQKNTFHRGAYAIWSGAEAWEIDTWAADGLTLLDMDPHIFIQELSLRLADQSDESPAG